MKKFLNNWNQKYKIEKRERIIKDIIKNQKENKLKIKIKKIFESLKNNLKITKRNSQVLKID